MTAAVNRSIAALRRRLEKWELAHLRDLAVDLSDRLERAEQEAERLKAACYNAENMANYWQENAMELQQTLHDDGFSVGITKEGEIVAFKTAAETNPVASNG